MIITGVTLVFIAFVISVIYFIVKDYEESGICLFVLFITLLGTTFTVAGIIKENKPKSPQAIDVYRGNTTLQITYKDSIPVDTIVVFKNK